MTIKQCVQRDGQQLQQGPVNAWLAGKSGVLNKPTVGTVKTKRSWLLCTPLFIYALVQSWQTFYLD
jgi:hypothetical protein